MSEDGWRGFLDADGVEDWVVLHGGATAVFRVGSMSEAARLAGVMTAVAGLEGSGVLLTIGDATLTVRLSRDLWQLETGHIDLARAVSAVARSHDAVADRLAVQEVQVAIAAGGSSTPRTRRHTGRLLTALGTVSASVRGRTDPRVRAERRGETRKGPGATGYDGCSPGRIGRRRT